MIEASRGAPPPEPPALPPPPPQLGCRAAAWRGLQRHAAHRARALAAATAHAARPGPSHLAEVRGLILMSPPERAQPMRPREVMDGASNPSPSPSPDPDRNPDRNPNPNPNPSPNPNPDPDPDQVMDGAKQLGLVLVEGGAHLAHLTLTLTLTLALALALAPALALTRRAPRPAVARDRASARAAAGRLQARDPRRPTRLPGTAP
jgi:hypothetical protein